jgi:DNA-binding NarL/FixJ family response regulator
VFLVDDHAVVRTGLATYLGTEPGMRVVGQAANARRALDELAVLANSGDLPDVVLMDVLMPEMDGITGTAEIKRRWPEVEVVAVTSFLEESKIRPCWRPGRRATCSRTPTRMTWSTRSAPPSAAKCTWTRPRPRRSPRRCARPGGPRSPR